MIQSAHRLQHIEEYYFAKKLKEIVVMKSEGKNIINLGIGSPDIPPHHSVLDAMQEAINEGKNDYQSYVGIETFRLAIQDFYDKKFNVILNHVTEILPLMGAKEGIMHISLAFLNPGDSVLIPNPGYPTYTSVSHIAEANILYYDLKEENNWLPDFDQLNRFATQKPKIMWINYPHMPTGAKANVEDLQKIVDWAILHNVLLINDNPYSFVLNDNPISIFNTKGSKDIALELNSLSKTFNIAGWRVGMVLGKEELIQKVFKIKSNMDSGMYYGIQKAASQALQLPQDWYDGLNKIYAERREIVWKLCENLNLKFDKNKAGMFVWAEIQDGRDDKQWADDLLYSKYVFITPGSIFGSNGKGYVRFSLCSDINALHEAVKRLT